MTTPAGQLLSLPPPRLSPQALARHAWQHWGLTGPLTPLTSERDQNHRPDTPGASFTLKLSNPAEPARLTDCQTRALLHVGPSLPVPRPIPAQDGRHIVQTPDGALRLLTWCPGTPLAQLPRTPALARAIGTALGQLDAALASFRHPAADHPLLWDIRQAGDLATLLPALPQDLRPAAQTFLTRFQTHIAPALANLPRQVIHGDFNPHNLLADPAAPSTLTGILDFGDLTLSHRICDLAVAASYLIDTDPLLLLVPLARAYHRANPLTEPELALLPDLITARLIATLTISAWRAALYPENAAYILRNAPTSRTGLAALAATDPARLTEALLTACESPAP